ncbi:uncharacterized protein YndB with AHSA1/START domain/dihydrofolate reductase [Actinoalloteichus hoggarensis]|uniref:Uncharacterized protein n=1 Tax=Actinoalloteichus hoggarensis TaxID=1470176 RepID=A0A221W885_9PSEU|nr:SRPBCC domain-containing protein [Actinoalloteichus hoggarensis]ASO21739.1 hypothetical protein AHOG_20610 [Actinoalloteichus hoggarensis]MBB5922335.1 uncharacterized protein YndB with AHSA1/START domain/dihydrofolate reductase [Actinoalloteichus hoggarensis]
MTSSEPTTISAEPGSPFIDVVREFRATPARVFRATPARVFRASTESELVARWLGPRELDLRVEEYDARPAGAYRYVHRDTTGQEYAFRGVFHTVTANTRIVKTFEFDGAPGQVSLETTELEDLGGRTRLRTRSVFPSVQARDAAIEAGMEHGVRDSMDRLAEALSGANTPGQASPTAEGRVVVDITMSLDGYVAAPGADLEHGAGIGGEVLHDWVLRKQTAATAELIADIVARTGAVIMGRRTFDFVNGPHGWRDDLGYGGKRDQSAAPPVFVVTHSVPAQVRLADRFTFVTEGLEQALLAARAVAGAKDVVIMGGGALANEFLRAGLVDVLSLHVAPVTFGSGTPLFPASGGAALRLELLESTSTPAAHHLVYRVLR